MSEMLLDERWSTIDSAEMALGVRRVLDAVKNGRSVPEEYVVFLDRGVKFLSEAMAGGALISGMVSEADSFSGTFSPLCIATDVYIVFKNDKPEKKDDYGSRGKIGQLLSSYENTLKQIKARDTETVFDEARLTEIEAFFKILFDRLLQRTDPIGQEYSRAYTL